MPDGTVLTLDRMMAASRVMLDKASDTPEQPVSMAIVDASGNILVYVAMDNMRLYSRRSSFRKAYTAAVMGMDSSALAEQLRNSGRNISEFGDPNLTVGPGGLVIMKDGVILGGLAVGGYPRGVQDEELARLGLGELNL